MGTFTSLLHRPKTQPGPRVLTAHLLRGKDNPAPFSPALPVSPSGVASLHMGQEPHPRTLAWLGAGAGQRDQGATCGHDHHPTSPPATYKPRLWAALASGPIRRLAGGWRPPGGPGRGAVCEAETLAGSALGVPQTAPKPEPPAQLPATTQARTAGRGGRPGGAGGRQHWRQLPVR